MHWLLRFKNLLVWVNVIFLALLVFLLFDTFRTGGDLAMVFMASAIIISTIVTLTLSYETLYRSSRSQLEHHKEQLNLLHNYFKSATLLSRSIEQHLNSEKTLPVKDIAQTLLGLYDTLIAKEQMLLFANDMVHIVENRVRIKELIDNESEAPNLITHILRTNEALEHKVKAALSAESAQSLHSTLNQHIKESK